MTFRLLGIHLPLPAKETKSGPMWPPFFFRGHSSELVIRRPRKPASELVGPCRQRQKVPVPQEEQHRQIRRGSRHRPRLALRGGGGGGWAKSPGRCSFAIKIPKGNSGSELLAKRKQQPFQGIPTLRHPLFVAFPCQPGENWHGTMGEWCVNAIPKSPKARRCFSLVGFSFGFPSPNFMKTPMLKHTTGGFTKR